MQRASLIGIKTPPTATSYLQNAWPIAIESSR